MPEELELPVSTNGTRFEHRDVYFGPNRGWESVPIVNRPSLAGATTEGPLVVEEYDSTTVIPPNWTAATDQWSNLILARAK